MSLRTRAVAVCVLPLLAVACSSSTNKSAKSTTTTSTTQPSVTTSSTIRVLSSDQIDASASPYCAVWAEIRAVPGPPAYGDVATVEAKRREVYSKILPLVNDLVTKAPAEIKLDVEEAARETQQAAETGKLDSFSGPRAAAVQNHLAQYALDHCTKR